MSVYLNLTHARNCSATMASSHFLLRLYLLLLIICQVQINNNNNLSVQKFKEIFSKLINILCPLSKKVMPNQGSGESLGSLSTFRYSTNHISYSFSKHLPSLFLSFKCKFSCKIFLFFYFQFVCFRCTVAGL